MIPNTPWLHKSILRSWSGQSEVLRPQSNREFVKGVEHPCFPAIAPKHHNFWEDLHGGMDQNISNSANQVKNDKKQLMSDNGNQSYIKNIKKDFY